MKVDAHLHFWQAVKENADQGPASRSRSYLPHHLKPILAEHRVDKLIVVQASPTLEENDFLLQTAEQHEEIIGVVGWVDLEADDAEQIWEAYRENPYFLGIRPMIQDLPTAWLLKENVIANLHKLANEQIPIDFQANPRHLPVILKLLKQIPHLRGVIDHIGKPSIQVVQDREWTKHIRKIAEHPQIMCKVSGLVPEITGAQWSITGISPYAKQILDAFGPDRVMFGSDWPVCLRSASYNEVMQIFEETIADHLSPLEKEAVYAHNACRFYQANGKS